MAQKMMVVWVASPRQPVPPPHAREGQAGAPVELVGLSMRVYPDRKSCRAPRDGEAHFCKARQALRVLGDRPAGAGLGVAGRARGGGGQRAG